MHYEFNYDNTYEQYLCMYVCRKNDIMENG